MTPRKLKITENHSTYQKFLRLCSCAEELGLSLSFNHGVVYLYDTERDQSLPDIELIETDNGSGVADFPPTLDFIMIYDNPIYLAERETERKQDEQKRKQAAEAKKLAEEARQKIEEEERKQRVEQEERKKLKELKAKYPEEV